jgi:hypothetical protein
VSDNTLEHEVTETSTTTTQDGKAGKTYTQEEFDRHMSGLKQSLAKKFEKTYGDIDIDEYKTLKQKADEAKQAESLRRGEFDKVMQELAAKKDGEIQKRDQIIKEYKINTPLVSTAAQLKCVNPDQVRALLQPNVRLNADGEVEIVDAKGTVRYSDKGVAFTVEDLVKEFLTTNPHFAPPTPATTNSQSSFTASGNGAIDLSKLDMSNPSHRKIYAEAKAKAKG